jgi:AbiTii
MGADNRPTASRSELGILVQSVQRLANDDTRSIAECLRNALVLSERLGRQETMHEWLLWELNGYPDIKSLPPYRVIRGLPIKATFMGFGGSMLQNYPLAIFSFPKEYQHYFEAVHCLEGAPALEALVATGTETLHCPIRAEFVHVCRSDILRDMVMVEAWWELSGAAVRGVLQNVRWRILSMTLELEKDFPPPPKGDEIAVDSARVTQIVHQVFHAPVGNVASGSGIVQSAMVGLTAGDFSSLASALRGIGIEDAEIAALEVAAKEDREAGKPPLTGKVGAWMARAMEKLLAAGGSVATATATQVLPKLLMDYFGLK